MSRPSLSSVKQLFAHSGNQCAFPHCTQELVTADGLVIGEICHISAASPGGPRFQSDLDDAERNAAENLLLLCPVHHTVIDADVETYTMERLRRMKEAHEAAHVAVTAVSADVVQRLLQNSLVTVGGSVITTINQLGGQVAHSITNIGALPRTISPGAVQYLHRLLRDFPPEHAEMHVPTQKPEPYDLAAQLKSALVGAGWTIGEIQMGLYSGGPHRGVRVEFPEEVPAVAAPLLEWLGRAGLEPQGARVKGNECVRFFVGHPSRGGAPR